MRQRGDVYTAGDEFTLFYSQPRACFNFSLSVTAGVNDVHPLVYT